MARNNLKGSFIATRINDDSSRQNLDLNTNMFDTNLEGTNDPLSEYLEEESDTEHGILAR